VQGYAHICTPSTKRGGRYAFFRLKFVGYKNGQLVLVSKLSSPFIVRARPTREEDRPDPKHVVVHYPFEVVTSPEGMDPTLQGLMKTSGYRPSSAASTSASSSTITSVPNLNYQVGEPVPAKGSHAALVQQQILNSDFHDSGYSLRRGVKLDLPSIAASTLPPIDATTAVSSYSTRVATHRKYIARDGSPSSNPKDSSKSSFDLPSLDSLKSQKSQQSIPGEKVLNPKSFENMRNVGPVNPDGLFNTTVPMQLFQSNNGSALNPGLLGSDVTPQSCITNFMLHYLFRTFHLYDDTFWTAMSSVVTDMHKSLPSYILNEYLDYSMKHGAIENEAEEQGEQISRKRNREEETVDRFDSNSSIFDLGRSDSKSGWTDLSRSNSLNVDASPPQVVVDPKTGVQRTVRPASDLSNFQKSSQPSPAVPIDFSSKDSTAAVFRGFATQERGSSSSASVSERRDRMKNATSSSEDPYSKPVSSTSPWPWIEVKRMKAHRERLEHLRELSRIEQQQLYIAQLHTMIQDQNQRMNVDVGKAPALTKKSPLVASTLSIASMIKELEALQRLGISADATPAQYNASSWTEFLARESRFRYPVTNSVPIRNPVNVPAYSQSVPVAAPAPSPPPAPKHLSKNTVKRKVGRPLKSQDPKYVTSSIEAAVGDDSGEPIASDFDLRGTKLRDESRHEESNEEESKSKIDTFQYLLSAIETTYGAEPVSKNAAILSDEVPQ
jgi:hypothetical protein